MKNKKIVVVLLAVLFFIFSLNTSGEEIVKDIIGEDELTELIPWEYKGYFGEGEVFSAKPMGNDVLYEVVFERVGTKKLMGNFARMKKIK